MINFISQLQQLMARKSTSLAVTTVLATGVVSRSASAVDCPKKIAVKVSGIEANYSNEQDKISEIFKLGDEQTSPDYIEAMLQVAKSLEETNDILVLSKSRSGFNDCNYVGKHTRLHIDSTFSEGKEQFVAELSLGEINYTSNDGTNPISHKGNNALGLSTRLLDLDKESIRAAKNKKSTLGFNLSIQIPLGDYGTDGFEEFAEIGKAWVEYSVVK